jgi:hypothetical protein
MEYNNRVPIVLAVQIVQAVNRLLKKTCGTCFDKSAQHVEAVHRFKTDRETSMKVLAKSLALSDKQLLERTYDGAIAEHKLPKKQYPTLAGLKTILASDPKAKGAKAEDFVDLRFIKELDESGYIDKLYKK